MGGPNSGAGQVTFSITAGNFYEPFPLSRRTSLFLLPVRSFQEQLAPRAREDHCGLTPLTVTTA